jgi:hypothetical protein
MTQDSSTFGPGVLGRGGAKPRAFWNALGMKPHVEPTADFDSGVFVWPK